MERCDRNLVWPNDLQVVWVVDGAGGVFDRDGAKKEAKKGVVHLLLGHFHHHHQCEMETGHHNDLANQNRE